jgi:phosphoserine phosphatase RsbU/P
MTERPTRRSNSGFQTGELPDRRVGDLLRVLEISNQLAVTTDLQELLRQIETAALNVLDCERATVFVYDDQSNELYSCVRERFESIRFPAREGCAGECFRGGEIVNVSDAYRDPRFNPAIDEITGFETRNLLTCPLNGQNRKRLGVLQVLNKRRGRFNEWDETLLTAFAAQSGVALHRHFLLEEYAEYQRIQRELQLARDIQVSLLPRQAPIVNGFDIAGWNQPAEAAGGDFFDFHWLGLDQLMLVVADVAGHGIGPALLAAQCYALQRAAFWLLSDDIRDGVTVVNKLLCEDIPDDRFITAFFGLLNPSDNELIYTSAGHGPTFVLRAAEGQIQELPARGPPLGVNPESVYSVWECVSFNSGDILIVFTDGFFESSAPDGSLFGTERICKAVLRHRALCATEIIQKIYAELLRHVKDQKQSDDLTIVILKKR